MQIKTKFEINQLVKAKFEQGTEDGLRLMEVKEINTATCYAGTQVFYFCRHILATKIFKGYKKDSEYEWSVGHGIARDKVQIGWDKYREDEIVVASKKEIAIISGK